MLVINNLKKEYVTKSETVVALEDVNFSLGDTGLVFIMGKSGSGKTTLLNIISGLDTATSGEILYNETNICEYTEKELDIYRNTEVGMVFQDYNLIESMSVFDNIAMALELQENLSKNELAEKVRLVLNYVGLSDIEKRLVTKLSGGQRQRVAIARALVKSSKVIFADEPTGNLDSKTGVQIMDLFQRISESYLVVIVTHNEEVAEQYGDKIIKIEDGKISSVIDKNQVEKEKKISEDTEIKDAKGVCSIKKTRLFQFATSSLLKKPIRSLFVTILFSLTLFLLMITLHISNFNYKTVIEKYLSKYEINEVYLQKEVEHTNSMYEQKSTLLTGGLYYSSLLNDNFEQIKVIDISHSLNIIQTEDTDYECINIENLSFVFDDCDMYSEQNLVSGRLPENWDEILITDYIKDTIFKNQEKSVINQEINISGIIVKVVGVIDTDYEEYDYAYKKKYGFDLDYVTYKGIRDYEVIVLDKEFVEVYKDSCDALILDYGNFTMGNNDSLYHTFGDVYYYGLDEYIKNDGTLLAGRLPEEKNEIIISDVFYDRYIAEQTYEEVQTDESSAKKYLNFEKEFKCIDLYSDIYNHYYDSSINLYDYLKSVKIVGIYDTNVDNAIGNTDIVICQEVYDNIKDDYFTSLFYDDHGVKLEGLSYGELIDITDRLDIQINEPSIMKIYAYKDAISSMKQLLQILLVVISVITMLVLLSYISYSIDFSSKQIGILRAIGVTKKDVIKIFLLEIVFVTFVALILSFSYDICMMNYVNEMYISNLSINYHNIIIPNVSLCVLVPFITVCMSAMSTIIPINSLSKMKPIDIIRNSLR